MSRATTQSLTGRNGANLANLGGRNQNTPTHLPHHIRRMKTLVFDKFIGPLMRNDWKSLEQNHIVIDGIIERIERYYKETRHEDLKMYAGLLRLVLDMFAKNRFYNAKGREGDNGTTLAKLVAMLPTLRLRPEYEVYNLILGEPDENEYYDDMVIARLAELIKDEDMTIDKIRLRIL